MNHAPAAGDNVMDGSLLARIAAGDEAALEALIRRYSRMVKAAAFRILLDEGEAEEIFQEVAWKVWQRASDYDPQRGSAAAWILTMAERRAIDRLRHRQTRHRAMTQQPRRATCLPDVHERELLRSYSLRVREAFRELSPAQRQILSMTVFRDMSQSEIAAATGLPLGTVKTRSSSAKKRLRQSLGWLDPGEPRSRNRPPAV